VCGITGFLELAGAGPQSHPESTVRGMTDALVHRGPDSHGTWVDTEAGVALGHRRLAIVDLSPAGHQPMVSADGRWVITYNGEVYNFPDLRADLEVSGQRFRGYSDTEVILELIARHGLAATVDRLIGMFAFALWDRETRTLSLVRDRMGVKPLYWAVQGRVLLFGSELKALRRHPAWAADLDPEGADALVRYSYIPGPGTIYRDVYKLPPGGMLHVAADQDPTVTRYWSVTDVAAAGERAPFAGSDADAVDQLDALLRDAVSRRLVSDVPIGAFLSGGIDSSTVVAHMQAASATPVRTFSVGFDVKGYDEAAHAKAVASHLGTDHTELYLDAAAAFDVIPRLPAMFDEPFADNSQIPTYLVAAMTRRHVTVALSGDGGDELFAGYPRHLMATGLGRTMRRVPAPLRRWGGRMMAAVPSSVWNTALSALPLKGMPARPGEKVHRLARVLGTAGEDTLYQTMMTHTPPGARLVPDARGLVGLGLDPAVSRALPEHLDRMQAQDMLRYLPDDIMTKVDRTSMAVSLEAREPLLDHRLVAFAWSLPHRFRIRDGQGKWLLRQALYRYVPRDLVERPKMGFTMPLDVWLRGPLRGWGESLLDPTVLPNGGLLDAKAVRRLWVDHQRGRRNNGIPLWNVLMLQAWREATEGGHRSS